MEEGSRTTSRKRQRESDGSECGGYDAEEEEVALTKKPAASTPESTSDDVDGEREDMTAWFTGLDGDAVAEIFDLLDSSEPAAAASLPLQPVKFIDNPYSSLVIFQSSSAYVTINGNEESCGSSFSDLDSSVMASVDMGGVRGLVRRLSGELNVGGGGAEEEEEGAARGWLEERDFVEGILVKSVSDCDFFGSPPPSGYNCDENEDLGGGGGCGGEEEMWMNFEAEDWFVGSW
ncbi:OLC1v1037713C1 [Oldenlandia corymbosa var. corymbosa]|uniref:OLC1v1037713C1 n=1 Tax=Oldenlandia corymbosa var. corymbosa TaxID=529605 RepID=A0AAV1D0P9_OLDCO|nr:OLC1v1037713C1 [Oldenlandia corymbosa var. corymbosa]